MAFSLLTGFLLLLLPQCSWSPHGGAGVGFTKVIRNSWGCLILVVLGILDWSWLNSRSSCECEEDHSQQTMIGRTPDRILCLSRLPTLLIT